VVYADSGAFIALLWRRDRAHARVRDHYTALREAGDVLLTSDLVVSETATRLRFDAGLDAALAFRSLLEEAVAAGRLIVRHADAELDARAWDLMERIRASRSRSPTASAPSPQPRAAQPPSSASTTTSARSGSRSSRVAPTTPTRQEEQ
jgi:predicted nucleic acid-binding protein